mmetsp:Transcript_8282/g.23829  ORF Transcript_8282/g.23829 Transcript_8282/m.23829 type:complete len:555 (+) Transcript_8282:276-1940(+)|eukprot:CAMPEP_0119563436 /NCGR_PEP_ID=MMETSP1352-20130426/23420_1 /TAXON_ID=265584 /ORGANISM="Stauroneis constricta, Strain CCMP1120" /LENGTH=554 /DNA_ID=CAMNT_0007612031 /DNA_START=239 /DNA_END=1903 /DNA_ORIENTATION=+
MPPTLYDSIASVDDHADANATASTSALATGTSSSNNDESRLTPTTREAATYWDLISGNREFRYFIGSYLITNMGEWLTYVATINFIEEQLQKESKTAIAILVVIRLCPTLFLSGVGGALADSMDRRELMVLLDVLGAMCTLLFVVAYEFGSVFFIYVAAFLQAGIAGLYEASNSSILPLLVKTEAELQKATTMTGSIWSVMMAIGSALGGFLSGLFGSKACFYLDSCTYLASAFLLWNIRGNYNVSTMDEEDASKNIDVAKKKSSDGNGADASASTPSPGPESAASSNQSPFVTFLSMTTECVEYLRDSHFGLLVFMKATGALSYGAVDILKVAISEQGTDGIADSSNRLGIIFASVGVGCLLGSLVSEQVSSMDRPASLQVSCIIALIIVGIGFYGWALFDSFWVLCLFAIVRSAGSAWLWIDSSLLLQKFTKPTMLGRVMGFDYGFALFCEAISAYVCGYLVDRNKEIFTVKLMSFGMGTTGLSFAALWTCYHVSGRGGAHPDATTTKQATDGGDASTNLNKSKGQTDGTHHTEHAALLHPIAAVAGGGGVV